MDLETLEQIVFTLKQELEILKKDHELLKSHVGALHLKSELQRE